MQITKVIVQKRRRSSGYVEAFEHVLSDLEASETYGYLVWVILDINSPAVLTLQRSVQVLTSPLKLKHLLRQLYIWR